MNKLSTICISAVAIIAAFSISGCSKEANSIGNAEINNSFVAAEFVVAPALAEVATFSKIELQISPGFEKRYLAAGKIVYRQDSCKKLFVRGSFISTEGKPMAVAVGAITQYSKGDEQNFLFLPTKRLPGFESSPKVAKVLINEVECL